MQKHDVLYFVDTHGVPSPFWAETEEEEIEGGVQGGMGKEQGEEKLRKKKGKGKKGKRKKEKPI